MFEKRGKSNKHKNKKIAINLSNRWLYTLITIGILLIVAVGVYASSSPTEAEAQNLGHDLTEVYLGPVHIDDENVGIGTTSPSYKLHAGGDIYANGGWVRVSGEKGLYFQSHKGGWHMTDSTWIRAYNGKNVYTTGEIRAGDVLRSNGDVYADAYYYNSDEKLKENIKPLEGSLENIQKLEGVSFNWEESGDKSLGFIAQDVEKVYPELVSGEEGSKSVDYGKLVAVLTESVKEQQNQIEELQKEIEELKS